MNGTGPDMATVLVDLAVEDRISRINDQQLDSDESFFVADLGQLVRQFQRWTQHFPQVRPFYGNFKNPYGI